MAVTIGGSGFSVEIEDNRRGIKRCESCTKVGRLHHLIMPKSTYRYPDAEAKVRYKDHWLCDDCYARFKAALENEGEKH